MSFLFLYSVALQAFSPAVQGRDRAFDIILLRKQASCRPGYCCCCRVGSACLRGFAVGGLQTWAEWLRLTLKKYKGQNFVDSNFAGVVYVPPILTNSIHSTRLLSASGPELQYQSGNLVMRLPVLLPSIAAVLFPAAVVARLASGVSQKQRPKPKDKRQRQSAVKFLTQRSFAFGL